MLHVRIVNVLYGALCLHFVMLTLLRCFVREPNCVMYASVFICRLCTSIASVYSLVPLILGTF